MIARSLRIDGYRLARQLAEDTEHAARAAPVPQSSLQTEALQLLAGARGPESYAGSTPLNVSSARYSAEIDIVHDRAERVAMQALYDAAPLRGAGFTVTWLRQTAFMHAATIARRGGRQSSNGSPTAISGSFPPLRSIFGYRLHPIDLAVNKLFAAAGRSEPRDIHDLMVIHETVAPLSVIVWAGVEKSPGFTPEGLIADVRRNLLHPRSAWQEIASDAPLDPKVITAKVRDVLDAAEALAACMPSDRLGVVFLDREGRIVEPDHTRLGDFVDDAGERRGHWPSSPEITQAMFTRLYGSDAS